jgi:hypothetical protein
MEQVLTAMVQDEYHASDSSQSLTSRFPLCCRPARTGPPRCKGGEIMTVPTAAAVANAVSSALGSGTELPAVEARKWIQRLMR